MLLGVVWTIHISTKSPEADLAVIFVSPIKPPVTKPDCVTAAIVSTFLMGNDVLFSFNIIGAFRFSNIPWYLLLGIISGFISLYFSKLTLFLEDAYSNINNVYVRLIAGGTILSVLIFIFPPFFGEGYDAIMALLEGNIEAVVTGPVFETGAKSFTLIMLFMACLIFLKVVASSSTNGAGGVGGIFAPSLFLGGITGFFLSGMLKEFLHIDLPDNRFVLVGMAGMMAGIMHAPLTAIFLIAEITGGYNLLIPLILTSTVAFITVKSFEKHSIYHIQLAEKGELITHDKDKAVMVVMDWRKEIETDFIKIRATDTLGDIVKAIPRSKRNLFPVVDSFNILEGIVTLDDVREIMFSSELYDTSVRELMTIPPSYIDRKESLETVMETFRRTEAWNLPVLDNGYYVGFISKSRIYPTYRELLSEFSEE